MTNSFKIVICSNSESQVKKSIEYLEEKAYTVFSVKTDAELFKLLNDETIHLVIIELDFKHKDGISLTSDIRNLKGVEQPYIIIFSNKQDDYIQITAFNSGADDFIVTPIKPILLEARIATLKKRIFHKNAEVVPEKEPGKLFVDKEQYMIITQDGKISLPRKEFEMISLMYHNTHKIFTRQDFANLIWNDPKVANSRTIDIHIRNIRRRLGNDIIKTSKGIGYIINTDLI